MKGKETLRALECCANQENCDGCPYDDLGGIDRCLYTLLSDVLAFVDRLKIERNKYKNKAQAQKGELARLNKQVTEQKAEIDGLVEEGLLINKTFMDFVNKRKFEAIKEFAERLCEGRVSNDPVVIAVKTELKMMEEEFDDK